MAVLTNYTISNIIKKPEIQKRFPSLKVLATRLNSVKGCKCGSNRRTIDQTIGDFKIMVNNWSLDTKIKFKQALRMDKVSFYIGKQLVEF